jgi:ribonuclease HI
MPWIEALLRGQKVLARIKADGSFDAQGGRVEIRYKATDAKAYRAAGNNLSAIAGGKILADDACVAGVAAGASTEKKKATKASSLGHESAPPEEGSWIAYTDGACSGNPGPAGSGVTILAPDGKIADGYYYLGTSTNNVAELTAILRAAEAVPVDAPRIVIYTDSKYSIGVLTQNWKAKVNQELIAQTKRALAALKNVRLVYVAAHVGVEMNERADALAREAITARGTRPVVVPEGP